MLMFGFGLLTIGAAYVERKLDGTVKGAVAGGCFLTFACFVGEVDAGWRKVRADYASKPGVDPGEAARLARGARAANDIGILLQVVGGLFAVAVLLYTY